MPLFRLVDPEGEDIEPMPFNRLRPFFEPNRFTRQGDLGESIKPVPLVQGRDFAHAPANSIRDASKPLKGRIRLDKSVILATPATVKVDLDDAESLVERVKDGSIAELAAARSGSDR